jgi:hypothetical protein
MNPADAPTVFVVDEDAAMRAAIQGLLKRKLCPRKLCHSKGSPQLFQFNFVEFWCN